MSAYIVYTVGCVAMAVGMILAALWAHRLGRRRLLQDPKAKEPQTGTIVAALLSLLGLLVAFTFSNAYSRFDKRRDLIVAEANAIGTAYLRLDLVPADRQPALREKFRAYAASRFELWAAIGNWDSALAENAHAARLQSEIWQEAVAATQDDRGDARKLLLPALNDMIDLTTTRMVTVHAHPPPVIFILLGILALAAAAITGHGMSRDKRPAYRHIIGFAAITAFAFYVIIDVEFPRFGLVTLDGPNEVLRDVGQQMK